MADAGVWNVSNLQQMWTVYINIGPAQGPLVVYRIHNDGPATVFAGNAAEGDAGGAVIPPGCDCDISGSPIAIGFAGFRLTTDGASGTFNLICCQPVK
jgi:hypothetical protein